MALSSISRPEYLLRPRQVVKRLLSGIGLRAAECEVELPWKLPIRVSNNDELGRAIYASGIYDLCLTEMIWRLTKPGDLCFDVGANIGYATSLLAKRASPGGNVFAFEPHPDVFQSLHENVTPWRTTAACAAIDCRQLALSDYSGKRLLNIPPDFRTNRGMAHFYEQNEKPEISSAEIEVPCLTLDDFVNAHEIKRVNVLKIDAEGHELNVLKGAEQSLKKKIIEFILFEDSRGSWRTPKQLYDDYTFIREHGYEVFRAKRGTFGLILESSDSLKDDNHSLWKSWEPPNFLALSRPHETLSKLQRPGWYSILNRG